MVGENLPLNTIIVYGLGYLVNWIIAPEVIHTVLKYFQLEPKREATEKDLGKWIGILERTLIMTFLYRGHIQLISVLLGMKSIIRFPEVSGSGDKNKQFAEYFLIGSMMSLGFAIIIAETTKNIFMFFSQ